MKEIIIDYENSMLITKTQFQQGSECLTDNIDKLRHISELGDIPAEMYMSLCKSAIIGFDFENDTVRIYKSICYDNRNGALYPEYLLQVKTIYSLPGFADKYTDFIGALGFDEVYLSTEIAMIESLMNINQENR